MSNVTNIVMPVRASEIAPLQERIRACLANSPELHAILACLGEACYVLFHNDKVWMDKKHFIATATNIYCASEGEFGTKNNPIAKTKTKSTTNLFTVVELAMSIIQDFHDEGVNTRTGMSAAIVVAALGGKHAGISKDMFMKIVSDYWDTSEQLYENYAKEGTRGES